MSLEQISCPIAFQQYPQILLAHGGGGRLTHQLISEMFAPAFGMGDRAQQDAVTISLTGQKLAFTTDSYVVKPLFFAGGDIGTLAVNGSVNDLAMVGAKPLYLSAGFILEEGLPMETLWRVVQSMRQAAEIAGVQIVTGDTKVVDRGKGDGIFINTSGIGAIATDLEIAPHSIREGDVILLNGDIGRHGIAIMAAREGLEFETEIQSDCMALADLVMALLEGGVEIHAMRDLTRGGLATSLNELASTANINITIEESAIAVQEDVRAVCEILGLDPLYVANEGRFVAFVPESEVEKAIAIVRSFPEAGGQMRVIGRVGDRGQAIVSMRGQIGVSRILSMLSGEQLPRIC
ncbi:hydrogenase expression/formation protein HypE [Pseudanabaena yagii]|uniref:Hydrogenase expression/formation protein HypE n=1 Tax=Pseudanabaena yagii GIHE-NHR1 TaxID=2722753 RepID=A0ABX1LUA9_9CYAN|nr:hydrogenase expression/formation protein HypE [Pseudanabaena yagii]NMF58620.1 hydrogenase expression/formation protein HypE [Pseudanabaena yagii GIHE-NHR1]